MALVETYWQQRASDAMGRVPTDEWSQFVAWLTNDTDALRVYEESLDKCLALWRVNAANPYLRLPEGL